MTMTPAPGPLAPRDPREVSDYFTALGTALDEAWRQVEFDEDRFPDLAIEALRAAPPASTLAYTDVIDWLAAAETLPQQAKLDEAFGQPPVTLFWNGRFQIDVLFWHTATTAIHQHAFCGAFAVLGGSSVHCRYEFTQTRKINSRFRIGRVALHDVELLEIGAMRPIARGAGLIHSLFHLDTPSVTVVVRTVNDPEMGPEYVYYNPSVALDPSRTDALRTKQLQLLELLIQMGSPDLERIAARILAHADLHTTFLVLIKLGALARRTALFERLVAHARERHGEVLDDLLPAIEEEEQRALIFEVRRTVFDPTHRFFLALLLNLPDRHSIDRLIRSRFPGDDPGRLVETWIAEIAATGGLGLDLDASLKRLLRGCLRGLSVEEIINELAAAHPREQIEAQADAIHEVCRRLTWHPVLRPLFRRA
jgi:hypothetical protein